MICIICNDKEARNKKSKTCDSCRLKKWRKDNPEKIKAYLDNSYEKRKDVVRQYRKTDKYKEIMNSIRTDSNIRRDTRYWHPLEGEKCERCPNQAKHRHHTTIPLEKDKFIFLCRKCHLKEHGKKINEKECVLGGDREK